ncbi:hypothetical protein [Paeniglutamicibacter cryotolerans]|uniref:Cytidine deaminase n=1 Tax=Paeniglutamicibacter cryotolerans TaxID=670079 RepID=A0A839QIU0_9MICC|nr:hypothetical protein [Paeniglutamicibacter cryotolerans]MBB2995717.1 cytidine deaminase [Paeniglutamicibacter cryotolerans]
MHVNELDSSDIELFESVKSLLLARHDAEKHVVAAGVRTSTGQIHLGLHLGSRRINVCAESSAIANAVMSGDDQIATMVALCLDDEGRAIVTNPCGVCRELMGAYCLEAEVMIDDHGAVRKVASAALMPQRWMFPHENDWAVEEPHAAKETN